MEISGDIERFEVDSDIFTLDPDFIDDLLLDGEEKTLFAYKDSLEQITRSFHEGGRISEARLMWLKEIISEGSLIILDDNLLKRLLAGRGPKKIKKTKKLKKKRRKAKKAVVTEETEVEPEVVAEIETPSSEFEPVKEIPFPVHPSAVKFILGEGGPPVVGVILHMWAPGQTTPVPEQPAAVTQVKAAEPIREAVKPAAPEKIVPSAETEPTVEPIPQDFPQDTVTSVDSEALKDFFDRSRTFKRIKDIGEIDNLTKTQIRTNWSVLRGQRTFGKSPKREMIKVGGKTINETKKRIIFKKLLADSRGLKRTPSGTERTEVRESKKLIIIQPSDIMKLFDEINEKMISAADIYRKWPLIKDSYVDLLIKKLISEKFVTLTEEGSILKSGKKGTPSDLKVIFEDVWNIPVEETIEVTTKGVVPETFRAVSFFSETAKKSRLAEAKKATTAEFSESTRKRLDIGDDE
jgi:hypothetical protein